MKTMPLRISRIERRPGENIYIEFDPAGTSAISYVAGQFLTVAFQQNQKEIRRSYSICSSPVLEEPLSIAVKLVENGEISKFLHHQTAVGDILHVLEPNGQFTYIPDLKAEKTLFLFAAGVGITPIFSILKTALTSESHSRVVLIYSSRDADSTLFYAELNSWQKQYPERFKLIYRFSSTKNLRYARLNTFAFEELIADHLQYELSNAICYTCGPIDYMVLCRISLLALGFRLDQIKKETYFIPEDEADDDDTSEKIIKDTNTYTVMLDFKQQTYELQVPYDKRILQVALEQGIQVPYSCRAGICSTCVATCTSGGVRMEYNEILTDQEVASGRVLICTAHPTAEGTRIVI